jgi:hypothetical protein
VGAGYIPVAAVIGQEHPIAFHRCEEGLNLRRIAADVDARPEPEARAHRRPIRVGVIAGIVPGRPQVGFLGDVCRKSQGVPDLAGLDFVKAN